MRRPVAAGRIATVALVALIVAACTSGGSEPEADSVTPSNASATATPGEPSPSPDPGADLPEPLDLDDLGTRDLSASPFPDFLTVAFGRAWVGGVGPGIGVYDAETGAGVTKIPIPEEQCAALGGGFGAVWTLTCTEPGIARIDPRTAEVTSHLAFPAGVASESSVGVGAGAVWALADAKVGCFACRLLKLDPTTMDATWLDVPENAGAVRAGLGGVWITYPGEDLVRRVAPESGAVVAEIPVGGGPLFLDVGASGVWVMNQDDGTVSHIDPVTNEVVATIVTDPPSIDGGDITVGERAVWVRVTGVLVARIDPRTDTVTDRYGSAGGSGSAAAGSGMLWISAHDVGALYRVPIG